MSHIDEQIDLLLNACEKGNTDIIKTLLNTIQDKSIFSNSQLKRGSPVEVAIRFHNNIIVNLLLVDSRIDTQEVFYWACYYGDQTVVQSLLNTNIPKNIIIFGSCNQTMKNIILVFYHTLSTYRKFFKTKCSFMDNFQ